MAEIIMKEQESGKIINRIATNFEKLGKGYMSIVADVKRLKDGKAWLNYDVSNIYDLCNKSFGMSRGTVGNLLRIANKCLDSNYTLLPEYRDYKYTQLLEISRMDDDTISKIGVDMTVSELSALRKGSKNKDSDREEDNPDNNVAIIEPINNVADDNVADDNVADDDNVHLLSLKYVMHAIEVGDLDRATSTLLHFKNLIEIGKQVALTL